MSSFLNSSSPRVMSYPTNNAQNDGFTQQVNLQVAPQPSAQNNTTILRSHTLPPLVGNQSTYPVPPRGRVGLPQEAAVDEYICGIPPPNSPEWVNPCNPFDSIADCGTILTCFMTVASLIGLIVVLVQNDVDKISSIYPDLTNTADLQRKMEAEIIYNKKTDANGCTASQTFIGTWGLQICTEQALTSGTLYLFISRWNIFRDALYVMGFIGCLITLILIFAIHRTRFPYIVDGVPVHPTQVPPIQFSSTNFFYVFRACWFIASCVISLWVASVTYEYWTVMDEFSRFTTGRLHNFLVNYDRKFVPSVWCCTVFLCWPIFHLALEICLFFIFVIPYYIFRSTCKQGIEYIRYPDRIHLDTIPGFVRIDMFFTEFNQIKRLGFSGPLWQHLTGTTEGFIDCFNYPNAQMIPGDGDVTTYPTGLPMGARTFNHGNLTLNTPVARRTSGIEMEEHHNSILINPDKDMMAGESPTRKHKKHHHRHRSRSSEDGLSDSKRKSKKSKRDKSSDRKSENDVTVSQYDDDMNTYSSMAGEASMSTMEATDNNFEKLSKSRKEKKSKKHKEKKSKRDKRD